MTNGVQGSRDLSVPDLSRVGCIVLVRGCDMLTNGVQRSRDPSVPVLSRVGCYCVGVGM